MPEEEFRSGVALENMSHEPLAFLSGSFKISQLRWATVDKEGFAIVFQHSYAQGECRMNALMHVAEDDQGDVIVLGRLGRFRCRRMHVGVSS